MADAEARGALALASLARPHGAAIAQRHIRWAWFALGAVALATAAHFDFPVCPLASIFGIPCPGCGLTRASFALLSGEWAQAFHFHPLVVPLMPFALFLVVRAALNDFAPALGGIRARSWLGNVLPERLGKALGLALLLALVGVWLARFAGFFGGPVATTTLAQWLLQHRLS